METFRYETSPDPIRRDLRDPYRRAWCHIAAPGTWLSGARRVAVAEETRRARSCSLCRARRAALSPLSIEGEHDQPGLLPAPMVDQIHRVTTDAAVKGDPAELAAARDALRGTGGSAVLVDAAGIIGNFERMVRIADGTGIPLDAYTEEATAGLREELGIDRFASAGLD